MKDERELATVATQLALKHAPQLEAMGLQQGTVGFNRVMFNIIDMADEAPSLVQSFVQKLPGAVKEGATIEALAKARADSFLDEVTGQWMFNRSVFRGYADLLADQRLRAGAFDYQGKIG
jgi:hypothetical protein